MKYDYLVVGAGPFGATFARRMADAGRSSLVIDRRSHIAGNCFTECLDGIHVHRYGPHIFHTGNDRVWHFVRRFAEFNDYRHTALVRYQGEDYSFPINLRTLRALWGVTNSEEAEALVLSKRLHIARPLSLRDWLLSQVGEELYEVFFLGYSKKQWGRDPAELPASIGQRIPVRFTDNDHYFGDHIRHEGIPIGGYTRLFRNMLDHPKISVELGADYLLDRDRWQERARRVVFSGRVDEYFDFEYGELEYRSVRFVEEIYYRRQFQNVAIINYAELSLPFTRTVEHKHFELNATERTIVTREFPAEHAPDNEPFYPIPDRRNLDLLCRYQKLAKQSGAIFGGRLGTYRYYNMDQVIAQAISASENEQKHRAPDLVRQ